MTGESIDATWYNSTMTPEISPEQRKALDAQNGPPIFVFDSDRQQKFVLVSAADYERIRGMLGPGDLQGWQWTPERDARRCELIDKDIAGTLTDAERVELARLEQLANEHFDAIAPPPVEGARRLHQRLLDKRAGKS